VHADVGVARRVVPTAIADGGGAPDCRTLLRDGWWWHGELCNSQLSDVMAMCHAAYRLGCLWWSQRIDDLLQLVTRQTEVH